MDEIKFPAEFEETAKLLVQLQKQLIEYKSALNSINSTAESTKEAANQIAKLASVFAELNQSQKALREDFDSTSKVLLFTQQKARQIQKDLDNMKQAFAEKSQKGSATGSTNFEDKLEKAFLTFSNSIGRDVQRLKMFLIGNIVVLFIVFFVVLYINSESEESALLQTTEQTTGQKSKDTKKSFQNISPVTTAPQASKNPKKENLSLGLKNLNIQILNGCGATGIAQKSKIFLEKKSLKVSNIQNADHKRYPSTLIYVDGPFMQEAQFIAKHLGISSDNISLNPKWSNYDITIVLGRNYKRLTPYR